jgi:mannose-6-phosphate isomerase-like protein (cupin superfamily)
MNTLINIGNAVNYNWGKSAKAFELCNTDSLSVKYEILPPNETEVLHFHKIAQQIFFVLSGKAKFMIDEIEFQLQKNESITIYPKQKHFVKNEEVEDLHLLVVSNPNTKNDRINVADI